MLGVIDLKNMRHGLMFACGGRGALRASLRGEVRGY